MSDMLIVDIIVASVYLPGDLPKYLQEDLI